MTTSITGMAACLAPTLLCFCLRLCLVGGAVVGAGEVVVVVGLVVVVVVYQGS